MKRVTGFLFLLICVLACSSDDDGNTPSNQITDSRDGQVYKIVTLGNQTWFAENLNYDTGDNMSVCYDDNASNCFLYGKLYHGDVAQTICPDGWHLPSVEEWQELFDYVGGTNVAHNLLIPDATLQGTPVNFNLLAAGQYFANYTGLGTKGNYWTSTDGGLPNSYKNMTFTANTSVSLSGTSSVGIMKSCRCVKD